MTDQGVSGMARFSRPTRSAVQAFPPDSATFSSAVVHRRNLCRLTLSQAISRVGCRIALIGVVFALAELGFPPARGLAAEPVAPRLQAEGNPTSGPVVHIDRSSEKLAITVNSSRILTFQHRIPDIAVNNPDLLTVTPLSPTQIQVSAKKPGVTQVNVWDEKHQIYSIDVVITGDARELTELLSSQFPNATVKVVPVASGVLISGYVDRTEDADRIKQIAEEFYPKVIPHLTVAGVQQILLHVKVYEVSRTKLRQLGFDFAQASGTSFITSAINKSIAASGNGVLAGVGNPNAMPSTFAFNAVSGGSSFFGTLEALRQDDLAKICSEPTLVTQSGRPAYFNVGGEIPYAVSQGLGAVSIEWKNYGTRLDFVPFVLGNGRIRLDVRPQVSEVDNSRSQVSGVPAIKIREADCGLELEAGQTAAFAGLVQTRVEAQKRGLPWVMDLPYIGGLFRHETHESNEIETLILVTPEIAEALDPHEVPPCGPGTNSDMPTDWELYMLGKLERPKCPPGCQRGSTPTSASQGDPGSAEVIANDPQAAARQPQTNSNATGSASTHSPAASGEVGSRNSRYNPPRSRSQTANSGAPGDASALPGFQGPIGYDVGK